MAEVLDDRAVRLIASSILVELLDAVPNVNHKRNSPLGGSKTLTSSGVPGEVPNSNQSAVVVELQQAEPRSWVISMNGIAPLVTELNGVFVFPFAKFCIEWGQQAAILKTEVDAYSDQYLTVFGNFVRVSLQWDLAEFVRVDAELFAVLGVHVSLPTLLRGTVAIAPGEGSITSARRTFPIIQAAVPVAVVLPVPLAATACIMRDPFPTLDWLTTGLLQWQATQNVTTTIDLWDPVVNLVTHTLQQPGQLPSLANFLRVSSPAAPAGATCFIEFTLRP